MGWESGSGCVVGAGVLGRRAVGALEAGVALAGAAVAAPVPFLNFAAGHLPSVSYPSATSEPCASIFLSHWVTLNQTWELACAHGFAKAFATVLRPGDVVVHANYYMRKDEWCGPCIDDGFPFPDPRRVRIFVEMMRVIADQVESAGA